MGVICSIADKHLRDRLEPASSSYFGIDYFIGIKGYYTVPCRLMNWRQAKGILQKIWQENVPVNSLNLVHKWDESASH